MNLNEFSDQMPGRLVQASVEQKTYLAFVPAPLPPVIEPDWNLTRLNSEADRALSALAGLGAVLPNPSLLIAPFIRREAVLSSKIEGTQADILDVYAYEAGQLPLPGFDRPAAPKQDVQEVVNYIRAMQHGIDSLQRLPISLRLICEIHSILLEGVRGANTRPGCFRDRQNYIAARNEPIETARYVPPPPGELSSGLDAFEKYLHREDRYPPLVRLALIHYQFEALHPFVDGNGRIGRLLTSLLLLDWKLLDAPLLYLSAYFERNRQTYYDLLLGVSQKANWMGWISFFLEGVREQSYDAVDRGRRLQRLQQDWQERLSGVRSAMPLHLANYLFESPIVTIPQVKKNFKVSYNTAEANIGKLQET